jgi:hypothetical protein
MAKDVWTNRWCSAAFSGSPRNNRGAGLGQAVARLGNILGGIFSATVKYTRATRGDGVE